MADVATLIEGIFSSGYPATWATWTPTYGGGASMTFTSTSTIAARYIQAGKMVLYFINVTGTIGGTPSSWLTFTLPVTRSAGNYNCVGAGWVADATPSIAGFVDAGTSTTTMRVFKATGANYNAGINFGFGAIGMYEAA